MVELSKTETYVVFAALCAMVEDNHSPQDTMTEEQWDVAEQLYKKVLKKVEDGRDETSHSDG